MGEVLLVQVDDTTAEILCGRSMPDDVACVPVDVPENSLFHLRTPGGVDALVLGTSLPEPIRFAQRAHAIDRDVAMLILCSPDEMPQLKRALQFSPFLGDDVRCWAHDPGDYHATADLADEVTQAVTRARQRRRHHATLAAIRARTSAAGSAMATQSHLVSTLPTARPTASAPVSPPLATQYLARLLECVPVGVVLADEGGTILGWNRRAGVILQDPERDALGTSVLRFFPEQERGRVGDLIASASGTALSDPTVPLQVQRTRPDGSQQTLEVTAGEIVSEGGEPGALLLVQDVTRRAQAERQLQEALRVRDEFLAVAAHELKTPMTSLLAASQLARRALEREDAPDTVRARRSLVTIEQQARRMGRLVSQLLDISRIEAGKLALDRQFTDLVDLLLGCVTDAQLVTEQHEIRLDMPPSLIAHVDPMRMQQVIGNLLDNAIKYSRGGPVEITLEQVGTPRRAPQGGMLSKDGVTAGSPAAAFRLAVRDYGTGIPVDAREHIFERFFQAHAKGYLSGIGLGLYITRQIVEMHGGEIRLEDPPGGGAQFVVEIPSAPSIGHNPLDIP